ncbi:MAG: 23S rRNA (adenine(2503)-C(2))-methyltransferase RlmN [Lachnospiraceae bacterium]|nr:23S rRNA (adenine(2503)-C(2))-methyltransferase RlmN [Lachnospiraceae bacterium]
MIRPELLSLTRAEMKELMAESFGEKAYRGDQVYDWIHKKGVTDPALMSNLSKKLREALASSCRAGTVMQVEKKVSAIDGTRKFLMGLSDGNVVESVLMQYSYGDSACVSSQVGCAMGCSFCASAIGGFVRNLSASEMLEEIYCMEKDSCRRIHSTVVMGTGEPLLNYEELLRFIRILSDPEGDCISQRNITVSTCGIVPAIYSLAEEGLQINLAVSLHAPNDRIRSTIMPVSRKYSISEILKACSYYFEKTGRRLTFEYSLIEGVNDSEEKAKELADILSGLNCLINLIPVNPVEERSYRQTGRQAVLRFKNVLEKRGRNVTIRREIGRDIDAACGQLRKKYMSRETV